MEPPIRPIPSENRGEDTRFKKLKHHKVLFPPPFTCYVGGQIGAGKTAFAYSLLHDHYPKYFDEVVAYIGTKDSAKHWEKLPQKNVVVLHEWNPSEFMDYYRQLEEDQLKREEDGKKMLRVCILFDDMASEGLQKHQGGHHSPLERLFLCCRHINVSIIVLSQDSKICMNPAMRNNCFYNVLYRMTRNDVEKIAKEHCGDLMPRQFVKMYYHVINSAPHQFLLIDYKASADKRFRHGFSKIVRLTDEESSSESEPDVEPNVR